MCHPRSNSAGMSTTPASVFSDSRPSTHREHSAEVQPLVWLNPKLSGFRQGRKEDCCGSGRCTWAPCSVLIGNVPPTVGLHELKEVLETQGEVVEIFFSHLGASVGGGSRQNAAAGWSIEAQRPHFFLLPAHCVASPPVASCLRNLPR